MVSLMKVGLFIPCYIDAFFPEVGIATLELFEKLGCTAEYPVDQTCCCGFGGSFCVTGEAVSAQMGSDRVQDFLRHGAEYIASADMSCLLHMKGIIDRGRLPLKVIHIAQILNGGPA
jgi:Fe-S oxidoreductase